MSLPSGLIATHGQNPRIAARSKGVNGPMPSTSPGAPQRATRTG
jgi:hypothetical protein